MATKRKNNKFSPIKLKNKYKTIQMLVVVVVIGVIGVVVLKKSSAATAVYGYSAYRKCLIYYNTNNTTSTWHPTVQYSSTGNCVYELQDHLNNVRNINSVALYHLDADGKFGSKTLAAVKDFQKRYGLEVDGIVGPKTWRKIHAVAWGICHVDNCTY